MIHYKIKPHPSKKLAYKYLYTLNSRNTIYGIHRGVNDMSKTSLVLFIDQKLAATFKGFVEEKQQHKVCNERIAIDDITYPVHSSSVKPLYIQRCKTSEIELMSILHYFDMLLVSNVRVSGEKLDVTCFEYEIKEMPNRTMIEYQLRALLGKNWG